MNAEQENRKQGRPAHHYWIAIIAALTVVGLIVSGILPRIQARANLRRETQEMAVASVSVIHPRRAAASSGCSTVRPTWAPSFQITWRDSRRGHGSSSARSPFQAGRR